MEELIPSRVFIDSSAFVTLADRGEDRHKRAVDYVAHLSPSTLLVTTNFILDETVTRIRTLLGVHTAYQTGKDILAGKYEVITIDESILLRALEKMKKYSDKIFSFTDCTSFVVMEEKKIKDAFAFDDDFARAGFQVHPKS